MITNLKLSRKIDKNPWIASYRYSYISIHVEIVSNHLLYKTPTPSPTGDRERKLLYNAR